MEKFRLEEEHNEVPSPTPCSKHDSLKLGPVALSCQLWKSPRTGVPSPSFWALSAPMMERMFFLYPTRISPVAAHACCLTISSCPSQKRCLLLKQAMADCKLILLQPFPQAENQFPPLLPIMSCTPIRGTPLWSCVWTPQFINISYLLGNAKLVFKIPDVLSRGAQPLSAAFGDALY